jgi:hypothetical protein
VNEDKVHLDFWYRWLQPYYTKHELKLIPRIKYDYYALKNMIKATDYDFGWRTQQLQKLLIARELDQDYLILDAKNFFTKPCSLNDWEDTVGSGTISKPVESFTNTNIIYSKLFNKPKINLVPQSTAPYKIVLEPLHQYLADTHNFLKIGKLLLLPEIVPLKGDTSPSSEFILYSYIAYEYFKNQNQYIAPRNYIIWDLITEKEFRELISHEYTVFGVHRQFLNKCSPEILESINKYLGEIGFKNKLLPYADSFDVFFSDLNS